MLIKWIADYETRRRNRCRRPLINSDSRTNSVDQSEFPLIRKYNILDWVVHVSGVDTVDLTRPIEHVTHHGHVIKGGGTYSFFLRSEKRARSSFLPRGYAFNSLERLHNRL